MQLFLERLRKYSIYN